MQKSERDSKYPLEPMRLTPCGKSYLWGGVKLKEKYGKTCGCTPLAETWECSAHPDGQSVVASGPCQGQFLGDVIKTFPEILGTRHSGQAKLPILIKLIDAADNLSLQVHPDDAYAMEHEASLGKTEMWYVVEAEPEAELICGFSQAYTREQFADAIKNSNALPNGLRRVKVKAGDSFLIEPGTIHTIGKGCLIAEIQQNSNITYRVFDYGRVDKNGLKRELHLDKALDVINFSVYRPQERLDLSKDDHEQELCSCPYFRVSLLTPGETGVSRVCTDQSFQVLLVIKGEAVVEHDSESLTLKAGECLFLPAKLGEYSLKGQAQILLTVC